MTVSPKVEMPGGLVALAEAIWRAKEVMFALGKHTDVEELDWVNVMAAVHIQHQPPRRSTRAASDRIPISAAIATSASGAA
jgi:hypothetical protein